MKKIAKSQVSVEMLLLFGFMMAVMMVFLYVITNRITDAQQAKERAQIDDLSASIDSEIKLAVSVTGGYRREITLPNTAGGLSYDVIFLDAATIQGNHTELVLRLTGTSNKYETVLFFPSNIYDSLAKERNTITKVQKG